MDWDKSQQSALQETEGQTEAVNAATRATAAAEAAEAELEQQLQQARALGQRSQVGPQGDS